MARKNTSIKQRLMSLIMSISWITVVLTTLIISVIGVFNLRQNIVDELDVSASIVGDRNTAALLFNDNMQAEINLRVFCVKQTIVRACLYNQNGEVFASYAQEDCAESIKSRRSSDCPNNLKPRVEEDGDRLRLMKPIVKMGDTIGTIYIESTLEEIDRYISKQTTIAVIVTVAVLVVAYLLAIRLQQVISQPILQLADTARQISVQKDYSIRARPLGDIKAESNNELVILTDSFNRMLTEIGERDRQLKKQNTELERARDAAEAANRAKSQFLANISHELRTPLNAVIGFSSILMNQLFGALGDPKYLEYSKDINESGTHLLDIINDILDLSKAEAGKLTLSYEEVHVGKAIQKCITILSERAEKNRVTVTTDIPKTLPPLVVDRLRFIQILLNVLSNAVKFTPEEGKVHIVVRARETSGEVTHFEINIQDTGIGMATEDINKAFQSFGQIDSGLDRKYEGTGLGLPLTKKLMELHHGIITIESEPGKGTAVTLIFPALPPMGAEYGQAD